MESMPFTIPGIAVEDPIFKKYIIPPSYKKMHWHLTYPEDGCVHQKLICFDQNGEPFKTIYENFKSKKYSVFNKSKERIKVYDSNEWFDERVFFRTGGEKGTPLQDFQFNDRCYRLFCVGFSVFNGYTLISLNEKKENEIDFKNDLIVDVTNLKSAVLNVYAYLHGKQSSLLEKLKKDNENLHYKLEVAGTPTIEIGLTITES